MTTITTWTTVTSATTIFTTITFASSTIITTTIALTKSMRIDLYCFALTKMMFNCLNVTNSHWSWTLGPISLTLIALEALRLIMVYEFTASFTFKLEFTKFAWPNWALTKATSSDTLTFCFC